MPKPHDYASRAAEFLKQWQSQMSDQLKNPDVIGAMLAAMQNFGAKPDAKNAKRDGAQSHAGDDAVTKLERRVDTLEHQLAAVTTQLLSLVAQTQNTAGTGNRRRENPVAKPKRAVTTAKRSVAKKSKPTIQAKSQPQKNKQ